MPKISIIIPVYNVADYLERSVVSLQNQTLKDIEIICIDDCSTDNSLEVLKNLTQNDSRFKIIALETNKGAAYARNQGLEVATGEYYGFIDPDDEIDLNYYEELYNAAIKDDADIVKCRRKIINTDKTESISNLNEKIKKNGKYDFTFEWTTAIYKSEMIKSNKICFPVECRKAQDVVFLNRCILAANNLSIIDNVFYYYHKREGSLNAATIPLRNIKSALLAISLIIDNLNSSDLSDKDQDEYIRIFQNKILVTFYTMGQNSTFKAKYLCIKSLIENFHKCKYSKMLQKKFLYKWMLPYIEKKKVLSLALTFMSYKKGENLHIKRDTLLEQVFSIKNKLPHKIITILGLKIKLKNKKLIRRAQIKNLEQKIDNANKKIKAQQKQLDKQQELINKMREQNKLEFSKLRQTYNKKFTTEKNKMLYKLHRYIPAERRPEALKDWFFEKNGEILNLENPQTFNEKIQWLKLYDSTPEKTRLADKYLVREWVKEKIGEEYLIPLLGVWDNFDDIDFDSLPEQFVLKCNHGCGYNIIVRDKSEFDIEDARQKIKTWLNEDCAFKGAFEMHYSAIPRKIIAEKYIENDNNDLYDYKLWCFDGKVKYIQFLSERNTNGLKMAFFDRDWNKQTFYNNNQYNPNNIEKPKNLDQLINLSEELSKGINYVRVDFYLLNDGSIKFGEMTFTPTSGSCKWDSKETNIMLGQLLKLPERIK